nr:LEF-4 [Pieris rapae granulovirus]
MSVANKTSIFEQELTYTFAYSQDVLYRLNDWLIANIPIAEEYVEVLDKHDVRTRIAKKSVLCSVKKRVIEMNRLVVPVDSVNLVPMIKRECQEDVYTTCSEEIKRVCKTRVFKTKDNVEIKFEQIFYEYNLGDSLDPLTVFKQIALYNILKPNNSIDVTINSHLGSDEILANCRLELEYEDVINANVLQKAATLINYIESVVLSDVIITPFISHTNILNEICYRSFVDEKLFGDNVADIKLWALKLNGIRGKGYIVNGHKIYIQLDDMQLFCGQLYQKKIKHEAEVNCNILNSKKLSINSESFSSSSLPFLHNRIVGLQVEYIKTSKRFYVTDVLNVYKYKYDNRNQYDISLGVNVDIFDAINFMNKQSRQLYFKTEKNNQFSIMFQNFETHMKNVDIAKESNDGYVGVTNNGSLVKIKAQKSYEMKYTVAGTFLCSFGEFKSETAGKWQTDKIYEAIIIKDKIVQIIKERPDRLISN